MTTATRSGVNSTGIVHAAVITLRRSRSALVTSTVGPWLIAGQHLGVHHEGVGAPRSEA